ncbi:MAG: nicotinate phosphoribosyltransferase [Porticoccaceae bacterium]|nr:nicotinate phosphoribosyltransferase [Porticoccaceae bacterium]
MNPILLADAYKISHPEQYPDNTEYVYSNTTARKSRIDGVDHVVVFGIQYLTKEYLVDRFERDFFRRPKDDVLQELDDFFVSFFGPGAVDVSRYGDLHDVGYLPLEIKCLPEGTRCPIGVPFMTIVNTNPKFYWLTNAIETLVQNVIWNPITAATIADRYRQLLDKYADMTSDSPGFVDFQGHNFSMRGMSSPESSMTTDGGHLLSFNGSDTLPGTWFVNEYYGPNDGVLIGTSVPATEHSVMSAGGCEDERETFRMLIQDVYPSGIVSIVSDTWDLWKVLTEIAPSLRKEIEARDGRTVFRPDSGDPVKIVCGYNVKMHASLPESREQWEAFYEDGYDAVFTPDGQYLDEHGKVLSMNEVKGCVQILDEQFGSTINSKGYKELNPKVGLIYGDSITYERAEQICKELADKGYASTNVIYGIGSFTFQYNTRDTFSIACKATWVQIDGEGREIFKDPVTDDGTKKSAKGLLQVYRDTDGTICLRDCVSKSEEEETILETVFLDGQAFMETFGTIRKRLRR